MTYCMVEKNGWMNSFFWLSRFCRMPSDTDTLDRFSSSTPSAMPLTYRTMSGAWCWPWRRRLDRDLLGDREAVALGVLPVDEPDGLGLRADVGLDLHAVTQQLVDAPVAVVEGEAGVAGDLHDLGDGAADEVLAVFAVAVALVRPEEVLELGLDDVAVVGITQIAEVLVVQFVDEQLRHAPLGPLLGVADGAHGRYASRRSGDQTCSTSA
jgi:hypothetical protein